MGLKIHVRIEGNDWEHNLSYGFIVPMDISAFEKYPQFLYEHLERYRREMEEKYKKDIIENKHHLKLVNNAHNA